MTMRPILVIALNTFREYLRDKILYNLLLFAVLLMGASVLLADLTIMEHHKIIKDMGLAAINLGGVMIAIFVGIGLVSKEIERRTVYTIMARPISRAQFILGKYLGLVITLSVNVVVMMAVFLGTMLLYRVPVQMALFQAVELIFVEVLLVTALALFFSTFTSSTLKRHHDNRDVCDRSSDNGYERFRAEQSVRGHHGLCDWVVLSLPESRIAQYQRSGRNGHSGHTYLPGPCDRLWSSLCDHPRRVGLRNIPEAGLLVKKTALGMVREMRVLTVAGAHLQFIKAAEVSRALDVVNKTSGKQESLERGPCAYRATLRRERCLQCLSNELDKMAVGCK